VNRYFGKADVHEYRERSGGGKLLEISSIPSSILEDGHIYRDMQIKSILLTQSRLTSAAPADEPEVVEFGDLVLHQRGRVPQFRATVLIVPGPNGHKSTVPDLAEGYHLEGYRKGLVRSPMRRQYRADHVRAALHQRRHNYIIRKMNRYVTNRDITLQRQRACVKPILEKYRIDGSKGKENSIIFAEEIQKRLGTEADHPNVDIQKSFHAHGPTRLLSRRVRQRYSRNTCANELAGMLGEQAVQRPLGEQVGGESIIGQMISAGGTLRRNLVRQVHPSPRRRDPRSPYSRPADLAHRVRLMRRLMTATHWPRIGIV